MDNFFVENVVAVNKLAMDSITIGIIVLFGVITILMFVFGYHQLRKNNLHVHERYVFTRYHIFTCINDQFTRFF
mgnify:CR=1 FL=1